MPVFLELSPTDPQVQDGLREIRRRRRLLWTLFLAAIPVMLLVQRVSSLFVSSETPVWIASGLWAVVLIVANAYVGQCVCPRCGHDFNRRGLLYFGSTQACLNCDLPLRPAARPPNEEL